MSATAIARIHARQIFDSRGRPTVESEVELSGGALGRAAVPSGASTGKHEALELRDGDPIVYGGLGVLQAVRNVAEHIAPVLAGMDAAAQAEIDATMRQIDGTPRLERLGANAVLAVSLAVCRAVALSRGEPLYRHIARLAGVQSPVLPLPMVNILSGGAHARRGMDVQDFLAIPVGAATLDEALAMVSATRSAAGRLLDEEGKSLLLADEGGYAPGYGNTREALDLMVRAIEAAGFTPGRDLAIALDVAATQLVTSDGSYVLRRENRALTTQQMVDMILDWVEQYPIVSVEDPLAEDDWDGWAQFTERVRPHVQVVGDDLFCTNPQRIRRGIESGAANAVLIKVNQIGTLTDTLAALALGRDAGYRIVVSARSGETEDAFLADLAVGAAGGQIKVGSLSSSERLSKYNQLVRIQEQVADMARWRAS